MSGEDGQEELQQPEIIIEPAQMAGVWANFAAVAHSPYEFTLDFVRLDFRSSPPSGIVVSRVSLSPKFIDELIQALQANWQSYAEKAMPQEVYGDGEQAALPGPGSEESAETVDHEDGVNDASAD